MTDCSDLSARNTQQFMLAGRHFPVLDGMRGLAILLVVVYHFADQFQERVSQPLDQFLLRVCQAGWVGVDLFFVLSGFLITGILLETRTKKSYFSTFYGRRTLRIFPAYYLTLVGFVVWVPLVASRLPPNLQEMMSKMATHQAWFWSYMTNWLFAWEGTFGNVPGGYFWPLAVEEQFYLVWPFFVLWLDRDQLQKCIAWLLPATVLLRIALLIRGVPPTSVYVATVTHLDGLFAGALVAIAVRKVLLGALPGRPLGIAAMLSLLLLVALGVVQGHFRFWDVSVASVGLSLLAVGFAWLLLATVTARPNSFLERFFCSRVLRSFGQYSYVIYLLHVPIGLLLAKFLIRDTAPLRSLILPVLMFMIVGIVACWIVGFASWNLFEKQVLKLKRYLAYR